MADIILIEYCKNKSQYKRLVPCRRGGKGSIGIIMKNYIYKSKKDGRVRQIIVDDNGNHSSKSYPRVLMEEKLGRKLETYEDVHHKDENPSNNDIDNLEIRLHGDHQREHSQKYFDTVEICQICGKTFIMTKEKWRRLFCDLNRKYHRLRYITCSKSCAGKAGSGYKLLYNAENRLNYLNYCINK